MFVRSTTPPTPNQHEILHNLKYSFLSGYFLYFKLNFYNVL